MTGIENTQDTLTVFGWRLEKTTTVQGALQTVLLILGLIAAPFALYYGFTQRLEDIERAQGANAEKLEDLNSGLNGELGSLEARIDNIDARMTIQERQSAVSDGAAERTQEDVANISTKLDELDRFLRTYITGPRDSK